MPTRALCLSLIAVIPLVAGCSKKAPVSMPEAVQQAAAVAPLPEPAPTPAPAPPVAEPDVWSGELADVDAMVRQQGLLGDVHFDYDRYELSAEARDRLTRNAEFLRQRPEFTVTIEGHCDERGTHEYNIALGDRRAFSALDYIESLGIHRSRLRTLSYGEERPQCKASNEGCWHENRRAGFFITGRTSGVPSATATGGQ